MSRFRNLLRDDRGASIIELAFVAPIFATMLVGMTDLSRGFSAKLQLTQAAQRSIEKVMQTSFQTGAVDTLKAEAASAAGVDASAVTIDYWLQCNGSGKTGWTRPPPTTASVRTARPMPAISRSRSPRSTPRCSPR
ncbi:pilus assembly protein [Sphingomonas rhizophila]|uniref:Pilus assembly protein n=2 Tax=Sphingomonas rhizophila TaxID=2071607 RepID=A0A7G9S8C6_9SPHN|nr:pilus assembly protein [Sphingomonas rhizophila]